MILRIIVAASLIVLSLPAAAQSPKLVAAGEIASLEEAPRILRFQTQKKDDKRTVFARGKYWQPVAAAEAETVYYGDLVDTSAGGRVTLQLSGGMTLIIPPSSRIYLTPHLLRKDGNPNIIEILGGMLRGFIKGQALEHRYEFRTKSSAAGVRGTDFLIAVNDGSTQIITFSGEVEVRSILTPEAEPVVVAAGETTTVPDPPQEMVDLQKSDPEAFAEKATLIQPEPVRPATAAEIAAVKPVIASADTEQDANLNQIAEEGGEAVATTPVEEVPAAEEDDDFDDEGFIDHDWLAVELMGGFAVGNVYPTLGLGVSFAAFTPTFGLMVFPFQDYPVGFGVSLHGSDFEGGTVADTDIKINSGRFGGLQLDVRGSLNLSEAGRLYGEFGTMLGSEVAIEGHDEDPNNGTDTYREYQFDWTAFHIAVGYSYEVLGPLRLQAEAVLIAGLLANSKEARDDFEFEGENGKGFMVAEFNVGLFYPIF